MTTAKEYRKMAEDAEQQSADSFERCDTDGFLSQWASGLTAQKYRLQANIEDNGGAAWFVGLYAGSERVPAKQIPTPYGVAWLLRDDAAAKYGRFVPVGAKSRKQKKLGLREGFEVANAKAAIRGSGARA